MGPVCQGAAGGSGNCQNINNGCGWAGIGNDGAICDAMQGQIDFAGQDEGDGIDQTLTIGEMENMCDHYGVSESQCIDPNTGIFNQSGWVAAGVPHDTITDIFSECGDTIFDR